MLLCLAAFYSCEENGTTIKVSTKEILLDRAGMDEHNEPVVFQVTTDKPWMLTCTPWLVTSVSSGSGGVTEVSVYAIGTTEDREGFITVQNNFTSTVITVKQSAEEMIASELTVFAVPDVEANGLMADGSKPYIRFSTNKRWSIPDSKWVTATPSSGTSGSNITVTLTINENNYAPRELDLIIYAGSISNGVNLNQTGRFEELINVAIDKPAQDSDHEASATGKFAVDGDRYDIMSRWLSADNTSEHWVEIDLIDQCAIGGLGLWLCSYSPQPMWRFQAWIGGEWTTVVSEDHLDLNTLPDADIPTAHPCKVYYKDFDHVLTDRVRWYFPSYTPNNRSNVYEIEVYGGVL